MLIIRLAVLSCAFYLVIALLAELASFAAMFLKHDVGIYFNLWGWLAWSAAAWLISTSLAFRIVTRGIHAKILQS
jgi:hypothetical protein